MSYNVKRILNIDRSTPFNPAGFVRGCRIEAQDERSLALSEIHISELILQTGLKEDESCITGEEKLDRLTLGAIQLDAQVAKTLYEEDGQTSLRLICRNLNANRLEFLGTVFVGEAGRRGSVCLYPAEGGSWIKDFSWLDDEDRDSRFLALGLKLRY